MASRSAEMSFRKGLNAFEHKRYVESLAYFESALNLEERVGNGGGRRMKYLSYYGLALSYAAGRTEEAIDMCERALAVEFYNPDLYLNMAHVYMSAGKRRRAHRALCQGLRIENRHPGLIEAVKKMGLRRRPLFRFLSRSNAFNRMTGRLLTTR